MGSRDNSPKRSPSPLVGSPSGLQSPKLGSSPPVTLGSSITNVLGSSPPIGMPLSGSPPSPVISRLSSGYMRPNMARRASKIDDQTLADTGTGGTPFMRFLKQVGVNTQMACLEEHDL